MFCSCQWTRGFLIRPRNVSSRGFCCCSCSLGFVVRCWPFVRAVPMRLLLVLPPFSWLVLLPLLPDLLPLPLQEYTRILYGAFVFCLSALLLCPQPLCSLILFCFGPVFPSLLLPVPLSPSRWFFVSYNFPCSCCVPGVAGCCEGEFLVLTAR